MERTAEDRTEVMAITSTETHVFHTTGLFDLGHAPQTEMEAVIEYRAIGGSRGWWEQSGSGLSKTYVQPDIQIQAIRCRFMRLDIERLSAPGGGRGMKVVRQRPVGSWFQLPLDGLDEEVMRDLRQDILDGLEDKA